MNFPLNNRVLILISLVIGIFLGGTVGFLLSPRPDYTPYIATIIDLENDILDLDVKIANLQLELAQNRAEVSNYTTQISSLQLKILELKTEILELEAQAISDWHYQQLQHVYFELKNKHENITNLLDWVSSSYYSTQNELNWVLIRELNGTVGSNGKLDTDSEEFIINDPDVKILWEFRSDMYENFSITLTDDEQIFGPIDNYKIIYENDWISLITYTRVHPGEYYHIRILGNYKKSLIEDLINGTLNNEDPDYRIKIYYGT